MSPAHREHSDEIFFFFLVKHKAEVNISLSFLTDKCVQNQLDVTTKSENILGSLRRSPRQV